MSTARDGYREYFTERLWDRVPSAIRESDGLEGGNALRALLQAFASQAAVLKRNQDRLWDDMFVELADDWAVPYIADLVATRLVSALNLRARRSDVAKTIYYRRRKGTLKILEQLCDDIAAWDGKLVEQFRRLARSRHGLDGPARSGRITATPEGGLADFRQVRGSLLAGSAFDEFHYTPETRPPRDHSGLRGISTLAFYLHRLDIVALSGVVPLLVKSLAGSRDGYTFDPSGREIPLFASGIARGDWSGWFPAGEASLPRQIDCRLYNEHIYAVGDPAIAWILAGAPIASMTARLAAAADLRKIAGERFIGSDALRRLFAGLPSAATLTVAAVSKGILERSLLPESGHIMLGDAVQISVPPAAIVPQQRVRAADLSNWATASPAGVDWLFDPALGRFLFDPSPGSAAEIRTNYAIGMNAPIGAGALGRHVSSMAVTRIWQQGSSAPGVPANGLLQLQDSATFANPPDQVMVRDLTIRAAEATRPYVQLSKDWRLTATGDNRFLTIEGLWIGGLAGQLRLGGSYARVTLRYCSLDPGGINTVGTVIPPCGLAVFGDIDELVIERCILPGITINGPNGNIDRITINDSIIDASKPGATGIAAARSELTLSRSTVIGRSINALAVDVERLWASDTLIAAQADVTDLQSGCFRFSARGPGSRVPHPYESHMVDDLARLFASRRFGDPHYAELSARAPHEITRGSEDDCEIGSMAGALRPVRQDGLITKIEEYMPFGRTPALIMEN
jgi:hypothetical protein